MGYEAVGNSCVRWGTLLVAAGALIFSGGWFLLGIYKQVNERLKKRRWFKTTVRRASVIFVSVTILLVAGSWMVGRGGTLTTKGWNIISLGEQKNNLIRAVAQELCMNVRILESPPMKGEVYYKNENGDLVQRPFPALRATALKAVTSSGLWDLGNQTEEEFLYTIIEYERKIGTVNSVFNKYNDLISWEVTDPNNKIGVAQHCQRIAPEKDYFKALEGAQNEVIKLLLNKHKWAIPSKEGEVLLRRIREKPPVGESEE